MIVSGCRLDRQPGRKYGEQLRFAELDLRDPRPRAPTLKRWKHSLPEAMRLAIRAPRSAVHGAAGPLRLDDDARAALDWTLNAAEAVQAAAVVLQTTPELAPGPRGHDLLARFVEELPRPEGRFYVWSCRGPWQPEQGHATAAALDLLYSFDPLVDPRPPGPNLYAELRAMGYRTSFSEASLAEALEALDSEPVEQAFVVIDSDRAFQHATRLQLLADD